MINYTYQAFLQENMSPPLSYCVAHESNVFYSEPLQEN